MILKKLLIAQERSGFQLIEQEEIEKIHHLWQIDKRDPEYREV
jgi:hypothetical protein